MRSATRLTLLPVVFSVFLALFQLSCGQPTTMAPSPAVEGPVSDGTAIDQGIAYLLLLVALAVTYLVH